MKAKFTCFAFCVLLLIGCSANNVNSSTSVDNIVDEDKVIEASRIDPVSTVILPNSRYNMHGFTCTGMTYDSVEDCFYVGNYGKVIPDDSIHRPSIIKLSRDMQLLDEIDFDEIESDDNNKNVQGVTFDASDNTLWISGGISLVNISTKGDYIRKITIDDLNYALNGVAYDEVTDTLWVLCYTECLLNLTKDGEIIKEIPCNVQDQDQLAFSEKGKLYFTAGADYHGDGNYLYSIDVDTGEITAKYTLGKSYAVEGICFIGGKLYVANDGYYHDSLVKENLVNVYKIE